MTTLPALQLLAHTAVIAGIPVGPATHVFDIPSDDRWHYPFNGTPGYRAVASVFGAAGNSGFNDRDATLIIAWNTTTTIRPGGPIGDYNVFAVTITLSNVENSDWQVDLTADEWWTCDVNGDGTINADGIARGEPGDTDGESDDADAGRPLELFGVGYGPTYTASSWNEFSPFVGGSGEADTARDPFPFTYEQTLLTPLHVEDNVAGLHNEAASVGSFTPIPWAIGEPMGYTPGNQPAPFDVVFDVNLSSADDAVRRYFQEQLSQGRVAVCITSLYEASFMGSQNSFPVFFTKEGAPLNPLAHAPRLEIVTCAEIPGDFDDDCDVDQADVGFLNDCSTGPAIGPIAPGCQAADLDGDTDVDSRDFGLLQACYSGPNRPGNALCLEP